MTTRSIYCCGCGGMTQAVLVTGADIYRNRPDLAALPFWRCPACSNYVGCHYKTDRPTNPLGVIPTPEIRAARLVVHRAIDIIWQSGYMSRAALYKQISKRVGWRFHTALIRTAEEADAALAAAQDIVREIGHATDV